MAQQNKKGSKVALYVVIAIVIIAVLVVAGIFLLKGNNENVANSGLRQETVTAENYEEIVNKLQEEINDNDDSYYFTYAAMYYMMEDAMIETTGEDGETVIESNPDETAIYTRIYGKTVQQLVDEGKQLMQDGSVTLEDFKQQIDELNNMMQQ